MCYTDRCIYLGTSDEHLSLMEHLAPVHDRLSSVIVTTPQAVALADTMKGLSFTRAVSLPVIGLIENMSGYVCPCCGEISNVFSTGGGEDMARREGLRFLGSLPVDTELVDLLDGPENASASASAAPVPADGSGNTRSTNPEFPLLKRYKTTPTFSLFQSIAHKVLDVTEESAVGVDGANE